MKICGLLILTLQNSNNLIKTNMKNLTKSRNKKLSKKILKKILKEINSYRSEYYLMSTVLPIHSVTAKLNMPKGNAKRGAKALDIVTACTNNTNVAVPIAKINLYLQHIKAYNAAKKSNRPGLWQTIKNDLNYLMGLFQAKANTDPINSIEIICSGGFKVRDVAIHQKGKFTAVNGVLTGTVELTARGGGQRTCHDWMYSSDGINWKRLKPTIVAKNLITGLVSGSVAYFTHELIDKKGGQGVSEIIKIRVA